MDINDRNWLMNEYWKKEKSLKEIGLSLGVCSQTVLNKFRKLNIPRRLSSKQKKSECGKAIGISLLLMKR